MERPHRPPESPQEESLRYLSFIRAERDDKVNSSSAAAILATPVRTDFFLHRRLPSFLLIKLQSFVNPRTKDPWILPSGLRLRDASRIVPGGSRYGLGNMMILNRMTVSGRWKKVLAMGMVDCGVWRKDMGDFVLRQMRERVYDE